MKTMFISVTVNEDDGGIKNTKSVYVDLTSPQSVAKGLESWDTLLRAVDSTFDLAQAQKGTTK